MSASAVAPPAAPVDSAITAEQKRISQLLSQDEQFRKVQFTLYTH